MHDPQPSTPPFSGLYSSAQHTAKGLIQTLPAPIPVCSNALAVWALALALQSSQAQCIVCPCACGSAGCHGIAFVVHGAVGASSSNWMECTCRRSGRSCTAQALTLVHPAPRKSNAGKLLSFTCYIYIYIWQKYSLLSVDNTSGMQEHASRRVHATVSFTYKASYEKCGL